MLRGAQLRCLLTAKKTVRKTTASQKARLDVQPSYKYYMFALEGMPKRPSLQSQKGPNPSPAFFSLFMVRLWDVILVRVGSHCMNNWARSTNSPVSCSYICHQFRRALVDLLCVCVCVCCVSLCLRVSMSRCLCGSGSLCLCVSVSLCLLSLWLCGCVCVSVCVCV